MAASRLTAFMASLRALGLITPEDVADAAHIAGREAPGDMAGLTRDPFLWFGNLPAHDQRWIFDTFLAQPAQPGDVRVFMGMDQGQGDMTVHSVVVRLHDGREVHCEPTRHA